MLRLISGLSGLQRVADDDNETLLFMSSRLMSQGFKKEAATMGHNVPSA